MYKFSNVKSLSCVDLCRFNGFVANYPGDEDY